MSPRHSGHEQEGRPHNPFNPMSTEPWPVVASVTGLQVIAVRDLLTSIPSIRMVAEVAVTRVVYVL